MNKLFSYDFDNIARDIFLNGENVADNTLYAYMPEGEGEEGDGIVFTFYKPEPDGVTEALDPILVAQSGRVSWRQVSV